MKKHHQKIFEIMKTVGAAFIEEKEDGEEQVVYINKNGKELLDVTILGSTVAYKLK